MSTLNQCTLLVHSLDICAKEKQTHDTQMCVTCVLTALGHILII